MCFETHYVELATLNARFPYAGFIVFYLTSFVPFHN